jgi:hypothetical protein
MECGWELRERISAYGPNFSPQNATLRLGIRYFWKEIFELPTG